ncbi:MAG TPA: FAD:protein FMN transferase, partial [Cellvibrionaceae bacterium]|nr:FAD:protein FMN transferase [Cellvibrionaceae bacterium]
MVLKRAWLLSLVLTLTAGQVSAQWLSDKQAIMGTEVSVALWVEDAAKGREAIAAVMQDMRAVDQQFSPYITTSELAQI